MMSSGTGTLTAAGLRKSFDRHVILADVSLVCAEGSRIGVVGPNGVGKTTLLRILAGFQRPDAGTLRRDPPGLSVGYLPQEREAKPGETLQEFLARRTGVRAAEHEVDRLAAKLGEGQRALDVYSDALDTFVALGGDDLHARAAVVCDDLGLPADRLDVDMTALSAGQAARAALAAILLSRFDVLLLDEPTNDLDFAGLQRLEDFLEQARCGCVVVSHDRAFLDHAVHRILEITEPDRRGVEHAGGWTEFVESRHRARAHHEQTYGRYAAERERLTDRMRRQREWSERGVRKLKRNPPDIARIARGTRKDRTEKQASKLKATRRMLDRLPEVDKPWQHWELRLEIAGAGRSGDVVARLSEARVRLGSFVLGPLSVEVRYGERIAILGPNGAGKSTLLGALLGRMALDTGTHYLGPSVAIGEMDQQRRTFETQRPLVDVFCDVTGLQAGEARTLLAKLRLGAGHALRACDTLSPGERTRAVLGSFAAREVNCLVLDEPTNHLDIEAIEQLESALDGFAGTVLLVTHDRWLLERVNLTRTLELHDGRLA